MTVATPITNRRVFLGGAAIVAVSAIAIDCFAAPISFAPPVASRAAWNAALANVAQAEAAFQDTHAAHDEAEHLWLSLRPKPLTFEDVFLWPSQPTDTFDSRHDRRMAMKAEYERLNTVAMQQSGYAEIDRVQTIICREITSAVEALIACPAPDLASVAYKIELARTECMQLEDIAPVMADLHRLSGAA
jgi:hypothetical protein